MATNIQLGACYLRARAHLNDAGQQIWTDTKLAEFAKEAYQWCANQIAINSDSALEKVTADLAYVGAGTAGTEQDVSSLLPVDLLVPIRLDFRLTTAEDYQLITRVDTLRSYINAVPTRIPEWEWRNRRVFVPSLGAGVAALLRLRYQSILPPIQFASDQILLDNLTEALSSYMAACAYRSRGQHAQAQAMIGSLDPPPGFGAVSFMDAVLRILVMNDQYVGRRGRSFSGQSGNGFNGILNL